jgi:ankyrin repeat protein
VVQAIHGGDVEQLRALLEQSPELIRARVPAPHGPRSLLHVATDWPGYFPNGPAIIRVLIDAGADPNTGTDPGRPSETPLHWAASSDDVDVAEALISGGADIEAPGASIAGGTPLDNAIGYGCWHVAALLQQYGVRVNKLWHAAALGDLKRLHELTSTEPPPIPEEINEAFWQACHGGQRRAAEYLLDRGADVNAIPGYSDISALDIARDPGTRRDTLSEWLRHHGATSAPPPPPNQA